MNYAYTSTGKLFISSKTDGVQEVVSAFAQQAIDRHNQQLKRNNWKSQGNGSEEMPGYNTWGSATASLEQSPIRIESATVSPDGKNLFYTLNIHPVHGLFRYNLEEQEEHRVFHKEDLFISELCHHPVDDKVAFSIREAETANIAETPTSRYQIRTLTEGDSVDQAPFWVPGFQNRLVYQSASIGRNQNGQPVCLGPCSIEQIDLETGERETLLEDEPFDFLSPKIDKDGNLFCIRRPYEAGGNNYTFLESFKDFILVPFRLLKALYGFLDTMSQIFGKQSLTNAATGEKQEVDQQTVFIKGRLIDLKKRKQNATEENGYAPSDWKLIKVSRNGNTEILKSNVSDFDITQSGETIHTNGTTIILNNTSKTKQNSKEKQLIENVISL